MTHCDRMSDRMPAVAHGTARWSGDEERHVARCEACQQEWELILRARDLGAEADLSLDETTMAATVLRRLRAADATAARRRVWSVGGLAAAAGLVLVLGGRMLSVPRSPATAAPERLAVEVWVPELGDLSADEVEMIMDSLDQPFRADELLESPTWVDGDGRGSVPGFSS